MAEHHDTPEGCEWFESCDLCNWPDCVIPDDAFPMRHRSPKALERRARWAAEEAAKGRSLQEIADFLRLDCLVVETIASKSAVKRDAGSRNREVIRCRMEGMHEAQVAQKFGLAPRTVRRICEAVRDALPKRSGNAIRRKHRRYADE